MRQRGSEYLILNFLFFLKFFDSQNADLEDNMKFIEINFPICYAFLYDNDYPIALHVRTRVKNQHSKTFHNACS